MTALSALTSASTVALADKFYGLSGANSRVYTLGQIRPDVFWCGTASGTANAITLTPTPAITAYAAGQVFRFLPSLANTSGTVTIAVSGLAAKSVKIGSLTLPIPAIATDEIAEAVYDGTDFQLITQVYSQGDTGAVVRTVASKLQEMVSIEDFGASESAADNAAAIQLALDTHGVIEIPDGRRYLIGSALTRTGGLHLIGSGSLVWTAAAATTGLTVSLTTADNYSDRVVLGPVQFRTLKVGVGTALTIDGSAQISGGIVQKSTFDRVTLDGTVFRGDNAPGVDGWLEHIVLDGIRNADLRRIHVSGNQNGSEAFITSTYGVRVTSNGTPVHLNITDSNFFTLDKAISIDTFEGLYVNTTNLVAVNTGIYATASTSVKPQITAIGNHINARYRGIDVTSMQQLNIAHNNFYQRQSATSTGTAVALTDCEDFVIADNNMSADYGNTGGVTWYGVLLSGTTRDGSVHGNLWSDTTIGAWTQVGTDNLYLGGNRLIKENASATVALYANTSSGRIIIDAEKFSGKNGSATTAASGTLVDVDMGTVHIGQKFMVSAKVTYTKGGVGGDTTTAVLDGGGTATVVFDHDDVELRTRAEQSATALGIQSVSGLMVVTATGTLTLRCQFASTGSSATIAIGEAQLAAVQLGNSMRLG